MNPQQPGQPEIKEMDVNAELDKQKTNLHNMKIQVQIQEAVVKKLTELAR